MTRPLLVVEIDIPVCTLTYGTSPCTAAIGVTGAIKCFNTTRTCQDKENFTRGSLTLRFCEPFEGLDFDAYPALSTVDVTPNVIDPGRSMGQRAQISVSIDDFQSADSGGLDKYLTDRDYVPFERGTFWGKMRARIPSMEGFPLRLLRGFIGDDGKALPLSTFTVEHYVIASAVMDAAGVAIKAKDFLSLCDTSKAQAPAISNGRLADAVLVSSTTATLTPAGIGDLEYPASGKICLSGKEVMSFTRSGDVLTLSGRGSNGTTPQDHDADSIAQLVLEFSAMPADEVIASLLVDYTPGFNEDWIDTAAWANEISTYVGVNYSAAIPAPTSVALLINEVIAQAGLALWSDVQAEKVRLMALRPVVPDAQLYNDDLIAAGSFTVKEQPDRRVSQAWTYYAVADVTNKLDKESNFRAAVATIGTQAELDYDLPAIAKTMSRWIPFNGRDGAERLNNMLLSRFQDAPRLFQFEMHAGLPEVPDLGKGIRVAAAMLQDATGESLPVPAFVVSVEETPTTVSVTAEEANFFDSAPSNARSLFIDGDAFNVNLWTLYNEVYTSAPEDLILSVYLSDDVFIGGGPAFTVPDDFPEGAAITIYIPAGSGIQGSGGRGGGYGVDVAGNGGKGMLIQRPVSIDNRGTIGGGGGGGGRLTGFVGGSFIRAGGGGGAGYNSREVVNGVLTRLGGYGGPDGGGRGALVDDGEGASQQIPGGGADYSAPGGTVTAGDGGYPGNPGETPASVAGLVAQPGGNGGAAIDGISFVTWINEGTVFGARIN